MPDSSATIQLLWQRGPGPLWEAAPIHCPSAPSGPPTLRHYLQTSIILSSFPTFLSCPGFLKRNYHLDTKMSITTTYRIKVKYQFSRLLIPKLSKHIFPKNYMSSSKTITNFQKQKTNWNATRPKTTLRPRLGLPNSSKTPDSSPIPIHFLYYLTFTGKKRQNKI